MKMYVFPMDDAKNAPVELPTRRPVFSSNMDAALVRLGAFLLAWTAGAGAAAFLALAG